MRPRPVYCIEMRALRPLLIIMLLLLAGRAVHAEAIAPEEARVRVEHHLRHVEDLVGHFQTMLAENGPSLMRAATSGSQAAAETIDRARLPSASRLRRSLSAGPNGKALGRPNIGAATRKRKNTAPATRTVAAK